MSNPWPSPWSIPEHLKDAWREACMLIVNHGILSRIGGSFVVNRNTANDLDVVYIDDLTKDANYWKRFGFEYQTNENGIVSQMEYDTDFAITAHYRKGALNLIAVRPEYWSAYMAAINEMERSPKKYLAREDRVILHKQMRNQVRLMLDPDAILEPLIRTIDM